MNFQMSAQLFGQYVKTNKCRILKGKEQTLYNTVRKYGHENTNVFEAIRFCCPLAFRQKMKNLIKVIPLQKKQIDLKRIAQAYAIKFIEQKYIRPIDFIDLVNSIRFEEKDAIEKIAFRYGMREQYEKDLNQLIVQITKMQTEMEQDPNQLIKWIQFQSTILAHINPSIIDLSLEGSIETPEELRVLAQKYKIFIIKDKEFILFDAISNLGVKHQLSEQAIRESTYQAFTYQLFKICQIIAQRKPIFDLRHFVDRFTQKLQLQYLVTKTDTLRLVNYCCFQGLISFYGLQAEIQQFKSNIVSLTSHLKQEYQIYEAQKIAKYSEDLLKSSLIKGQRIQKQIIRSNLKENQQTNKSCFQTNRFDPFLSIQKQTNTGLNEYNQKAIKQQKNIIIQKPILPVLGLKKRISKPDQSLLIFDESFSFNQLQYLEKIQKTNQCKGKQLINLPQISESQHD